MSPGLIVVMAGVGLMLATVIGALVVGDRVGRVYRAEESQLVQAFADLLNGARLYELWIRFAFHDIRQRFRRSA